MSVSPSLSLSLRRPPALVDVRFRKVRLRKDDSADQQDGTLTLHDGYEQELVFTVRPTAKAEPARTTTTSFVDILDVTLVEDVEDGVFCSTSVSAVRLRVLLGGTR